MRLPRAAEVVIDRRKLTDYLLSTTHPVGKHKARVFHAFGFSVGNAELFEQRLRAIVESEEVVDVVPSPYGTKYTVNGEMEGAAGGMLVISTVWIVESPDSPPRLVTAFPADK